jgi:hypothetical protein
MTATVPVTMFKKITFVTGPTTLVRLGIAGSTNSSMSTNRGFGGS